MFRALLLLLLFCTLSPWPLAAQEALQPVPPFGAIDWSAMRLQATGQGFAAAAGEPGASSGRSARMAERAAVLDARRNLLELFKSVRVDSRTVVRDFMVAEDVAVNRLAGVLVRNALEERTQIPGGVEVRVSAALTGPVAELLWELYPPQASPSGSAPALPEASPKERWHLRKPLPGADALPQYTGLIVDARGLDFSPSLRPALHGPEGLLYPPAALPLELAAAQGYVRYFRDMEAAAASGRGGLAPLVVKASGLHGGAVSALELPASAVPALSHLAQDPDTPLLRAAVAIVY